MTKITRGTGNVFADIGLPDAKTHLLKAGLVHRIAELISAQGLTQALAAERMGMSQPDVSKMLKGLYRPISLERLMLCLVALGQNVTIDVRQPAKATQRADITVSAIPGKLLAARVDRRSD